VYKQFKFNNVSFTIGIEVVVVIFGIVASDNPQNFKTILTALLLCSI